MRGVVSHNIWLGWSCFGSSLLCGHGACSCSYEIRELRCARLHNGQCWWTLSLSYASNNSSFRRSYCILEPRDLGRLLYTACLSHCLQWHLCTSVRAVKLMGIDLFCVLALVCLALIASTGNIRIARLACPMQRKGAGYLCLRLRSREI